MKGKKAAEESRKLFIGIIITLVVLTLLSVMIFHADKNQSDVYRINMERLADNFSNSAVNAHWQWQAAGRPNRIILISYNSVGQEVDRRPITMSNIGWPRVEPTSEGCAKLWGSVLGIPEEVQGFKVKSEFFDGIKLTGKILDTYCRFSIASGFAFHYKIYTGNVTKVTQ